MMRVVLLLTLLACGQSRPAPDSPPPAAVHARAPAPTSQRARVVAPALSARELLEASGAASFVQDGDLRIAQIDGDAMERWFTRKPSGVYLYTERAIDGLEPKSPVRGRCQLVPRANDSVLNAITVVAWQRGELRVLLTLGQSSVHVQEQQRERGVWDTRGVRRLSMGAVGWSGAQIRYAEGATIYEVACIPTLRTMPCDGTTTDRLGHCVDREIVVRPWRVPLVPHVGEVHPAYNDPIPAVPEGSCDLTCEPSACEEALRSHKIPRVPLYVETAPVLAAFRTESACRAYASTRKRPTDDQVW
ncbi:MAG: hypothetical protein ACKV2T_05275 [Kofleriaceae bacterium]